MPSVRPSQHSNALVAWKGAQPWCCAVYVRVLLLCRLHADIWPVAAPKTWGLFAAELSLGPGVGEQPCLFLGSRPELDQ